VIKRFPVVNGDRTVYISEEYTVGKKSMPPGYKEFETVVEILVKTDRFPRVEVHFENYGQLWLTDYVVEIMFEDDTYKEIIAQRKKERDEKRKSNG